MSVMSAAEARRAAGAGHQIAVPRPRAANSARGRGGPFTAGPDSRAGTRHDSGRPSAGGPSAGRQSAGGLSAGGPPRPGRTGPEAGLAAPVTELQVQELEVRESRLTQVRAVGAVARWPHGSGSSAEHGSAEHVSARHVSARHVSAASRADRRPQAQPGAIRLTRRGRRVVAALALALTAAVVVLIWLAAAGGAAASDHRSPANGAYQGLTQVVVRPGQTLWSIAAAAEPSADPRVVIQQIIEVNALSGATIHTGQLLWVPTD